MPPFVPVLMFAILFGLSMDYEVFCSRVREEYLRSRNTRDAVTAGLTRTARVITAAAAILVDAIVIRMVLAPEVMQLLGPGELVDAAPAGPRGHRDGKGVRPSPPGGGSARRS